MIPLGTYPVNVSDKYNTQNMLENIETHVTSDTPLINYMKAGSVYFIEGSVLFSDLVMDLLPEKALSNSFLWTNNNELLTIEAGTTNVTAQTIGTKVLKGFYFSQNGEN